MLKNCCFCINLRSATLLLATLGALSHVYNGFMLLTDDYILSIIDVKPRAILVSYAFLSVIACALGAMGVIKNNVKHLKLFSLYSWVQIVLQMVVDVTTIIFLYYSRSDICDYLMNKEQVFESAEECSATFESLLWGVFFVSVGTILIKVHFAYAIYSYYQQVRLEQSVIGTHSEYESALPPAYTPLSMEDKIDNAVYVASIDEKH